MSKKSLDQIVREIQKIQEQKRSQALREESMKIEEARKRNEWIRERMRMFENPVGGIARIHVIAEPVQDPLAPCEPEGPLTIQLGEGTALAGNPSWAEALELEGVHIGVYGCHAAWEFQGTINAPQTILLFWNTDHWLGMDHLGEGIMSEPGVDYATPSDVPVWFYTPDTNTQGAEIDIRFCGGAVKVCLGPEQMGAGVAVNNPGAGQDTITCTLGESACFEFDEAWWKVDGVLTSTPIPTPSVFDEFAFVKTYTQGEEVYLVVNNALAPACDPVEIKLSLDYP